MSTYPAHDVDDQGYTRAFLPSQQEELHAYFKANGFVVVRDVVSEETLTQLVDEIWATPNLEDVPRTDCDAWLDTVNWKEVYETNYNVKRGFLGGTNANGPIAFSVRGNMDIIRSFQTVLGTRDIWYKFDRYGFMRPTKITRSNGVVESRPDWQTESNWAHWDQNPWLEPNFARVQGLLAISNHTTTSGGFHVIPGFHLKMTEWAQQTKMYEESCLVDLVDEEILKNLRKVTMRKGSFVIWDSRLPHGNWPNSDDTFRMVMYLTFFPRPRDAANIQGRHKYMMRIMDKYPDLVLSDVAKKFGGVVDKSEDHNDDTPPPYVDLDSKYNSLQWGLFF